MVVGRLVGSRESRDPLWREHGVVAASRIGVGLCQGRAKARVGAKVMASGGTIEMVAGSESGRGCGTRADGGRGHEVMGAWASIGAD